MRSCILIALLPLLAACASSAPAARRSADAPPAATRPTLEARTVRAASNPILSDGADYRVDPAPIVAGGSSTS
jgi:hypothetical protein